MNLRLAVRSVLPAAALWVLRIASRRLPPALILAVFPATAVAVSATELVPLLDFDEVRIGSHRSEVAERIGDPPDRFSPDVWVYWNYRDPLRKPDERYKTLVIVFADDRISHIRFTDAKATRDALAKFRHDQAMTSLFLTSTNPLPTGNKVSPGNSADPEMLAATQEARASIGKFLAAFAAPTATQSTFQVRIAFVKDDTVEHLWLAQLDLCGAKPTGVIISPPRRPDLRLNHRVEFNPSHLTDWMYVDNGNVVGGFTTRQRRTRMSSDARAKADVESPGPD